MTTDTMRAAVGAMSDEQLQALWDYACQDSPDNPGWSRRLRFARAVLAASTAAPKEEPVAIWQSDTGDGRTWCDCSESNARAAEKHGFKARVLYTRPIAADTQGDAKDAAQPDLERLVNALRSAAFGEGRQSQKAFHRQYDEQEQEADRQKALKADEAHAALLTAIRAAKAK